MSLTIQNCTPFLSSAEASDGYKYIGRVSNQSRYLRYSLYFSGSDLPAGTTTFSFSGPLSKGGGTWDTAISTSYGLAVTSSSAPESSFWGMGGSQSGSLRVGYNSSVDQYWLYGDVSSTILPN